MGKISYTNLKLKINNDVKIVDYNGNQIEVLQYLPIDEKYSLVNITLQKAKEDIIYNPIKKDIFFHLNLIYSYTNINFTDKQREDEFKLYDTLVSNGLLEKIIENIPENEYNLLYSYIEELEDEVVNYEYSAIGGIKNIIANLSNQMENMQDIVNNFNPEKFQNVVDFAKSVNNGKIQ